MGLESSRSRSAAPPLRVVIVGGGVAALETMFALRHLAEERVELTLVSADSELRYQPASVAVPFGRGEVFRYSLSDATGEAGARLVHDALSEVDAEGHRAITRAGQEVGYDALVIAIGAHRRPVMEGAIAFRGDEDIAEIEKLLGEIRVGTVKRVVFALPRGASWALPLYELALLTATYVAEHHVEGVSLALVTPEERPLVQFGGEVSDAVAELLREHHVVLHPAAYPRGDLRKPSGGGSGGDDPGGSRCLHSGGGRDPDPGIPSTPDGFLSVDDLGRVRGVDDVYAAGDITSYPIKQGGIAAQQADLVAQVIANRAGATLGDPPPLRPVLRGLLITGGQPKYLLAQLGGGRGDTATSTNEPLWSPGGKVAARYLGPYLARAPHQTAENPRKPR